MLLIALIGPPVLAWRLPIKSLPVARNWTPLQGRSYGTAKFLEKPRGGRKQRERRCRSEKQKEKIVWTLGLLIVTPANNACPRVQEVSQNVGLGGSDTVSVIFHYKNPG